MTYEEWLEKASQLPESEGCITGYAAGRAMEYLAERWADQVRDGHRPSVVVDDILGAIERLKEAHAQLTALLPQLVLEDIARV